MNNTPLLFRDKPLEMLGAPISFRATVEPALKWTPSLSFNASKWLHVVCSR